MCKYIMTKQCHHSMLLYVATLAICICMPMVTHHHCGHPFVWSLLSPTTPILQSNRRLFPRQQHVHSDVRPFLSSLQRRNHQEHDISKNQEPIMDPTTDWYTAAAVEENNDDDVTTSWDTTPTTISTWLDSSPIFTSVALSRASFLTTLLVTLPAQASSSSSTQKNRSNASQESLSGFVAGAALTITKTVVKYPLDTATVRLQMPNSTYTFRNLSNLFDGSYRGVVAPLLFNIPAGAVFFAVKDAVKATMQNNNNNNFHWVSNHRWVQTALAVGVAQIPYWMVRNPSEVVKTRQQALIPGYYNVSIWDAYATVRRQQQSQSDKQQHASTKNTTTTTTTDTWSSNIDNLDAFYTGYWENIAYAYPADVLKFVVYEQLTKNRRTVNMSHSTRNDTTTTSITPLQGAVAGAAATALAQFCTTPLDVVRNRIMAEKIETLSLSYQQQLVQIGREEGLQGLFAGAAPRVGKALVSGAIQFATYEETKQKIAKLLDRRSNKNSLLPK